MTPQTTQSALSVWDTALPDSDSEQGTVVETFILRNSSLPGELYLVGQVYSSRERRENAQLLSRIVETLESALGASGPTTPEAIFEQALARTNRLIRQERASGFRNYTLKINMAAILSPSANKTGVSGTLYISRIGHGVVLRERAKKLSHVTKRPLYSPDPNHHLIFQEIVEVSLKKDDRVYAGTPQIYKVGEAILTNHPTADDLRRAVTAHKDDLRNLGLIMLHNTNPSTSAMAAGLPNTEDGEQKKNSKKTEYRGAAGIWARIQEDIAHKKPLWIALAVLIVGGVLVWALHAQQAAVSRAQQQETLVQEITTLEEKTTALVELENYEEATQLVQQIHEKIDILERQYGATPKSKQLREDARYLSSILPIRE